MAAGLLDPASPGAWQAEIVPGGMEFRTLPDPRRAFRRSSADHVREYDVLRGIEASLRAPGDDRRLILQVSVDGRGGTAFEHAFAPSPAPANTVVLDPDHRHPNHPRPGMPRPEAARPTGAPTDPGVLRHVGELVARFTDHYRRLAGRDPEFGEVRSEEELAEAERRMGLRLPEDVRALYRLIGDDREETGLLGRYSLMALPHVVSEYLEGDPGAWGWDDGPFDLGRVVLEAEPFGAVRPLSRSDWWVVVASDHAGNWCAVDLDPGPSGRSGQLIVYGRDYHGPVGYLAESVTARMEAMLDALDRDEVEPGTRLFARLPDGDSRYAASEEVADRDLADVLRDLPNRDTVQQLYLNDADALDLRALTATPRVRELNVNRAGHVRLWLPERAEGLSLEAREADLSLLAGHPTLWDLTVKGLRVRVADLARLPALAALDLSGASVDDPVALADLDVRTLVLDGDQWARLRAAGRLPKRLAAARRAGHAWLAELVDWSDWLTSHTR